MSEVDKPEKTFSRRKALQRTADVVGTAGLLTLAGIGTRDVMRSVQRDPKDPLGAIVEDIRTNRNSLKSESLPLSENPTIKGVEERLGIRLASLREAYDMYGIPFNEHDENEFNSILPMRWEPEQALLIEKCFSVLPDYFHEPDGNGDPLVITLTNFPEHKYALADYFIGGPINLMRIDYDQFSPDNLELALTIVSHEGIHYLQDLGYSRIDQKINELFQKNPSEFCKQVVSTMDELEDSGTFYNLGLRYGVESVGSEDSMPQPRTNLYEFEARLGELYLHGPDEFINQMAVLFGDKSYDLFIYTRDYLYDGRVYNKHPFRE